MTEPEPPEVQLTEPMLSSESEIWFSAYSPGWGYCAFVLPPEAVCEELGAADKSRRQLRLAFELGKRQILRVINDRACPATGERIRLSAADFRVC
jgi:hypothetical protein